MSIAVAWLASQVFKALFLPEPVSVMSEEKRKAFGEVFHAMGEASLDEGASYACPYPKWEFLRYLVRERNVVLHGSNRNDIEVLEPREQTDYSGKRITAVFASRDGIWPMFFALVNMKGYRGSLRNGCWVVGRGSSERRYYFFSLNEKLLGAGIWKEGTIYILPGETFEKVDQGVVRFDEWASKGAVRPVGKLAIKPEDFPFHGRVAGHREGESMLISWLKYKRRCMNNIKVNEA